MDLDPGGKICGIVMRRAFPKADEGKQSQGLGEAEKAGTGELVARKNTGYCNG